MPGESVRRASVMRTVNLRSGAALGAPRSTTWPVLAEAAPPGIVVSSGTCFALQPDHLSSLLRWEGSSK